MLDALTGYKAYLERLPVSRHTRRNYLLRVRQYLDWLGQTLDGEKALRTDVDRDFSVQDYKTWLLQHGASANTVNSTLAALDNFYLHLGLGAAKIKRQALPEHAPRALNAEEERRLLKAIAHSSSLRNQAIALLMLHCGLRISEVGQLTIADVTLSARVRGVVVRCGKNSTRRVVPINSDLAAVLQQYIATQSANPDAPLFLSQKGKRLSVQGIDYIIRQFARDAGVEFSSHCLRHTCLTKLVRAGVDLVTVAEVAGHSRLETTRRYSLPTEDVKIGAMEKLTYGSASA